MKDIYKSLLYGFLFAAGVLIYVGLVSMIMNATRVFENGSVAPVWAGMLVLLLLCVSAATVGTLIFGRPIYLLIDKRLKDAVTQLLLTLGWLAIFLISAFLIIVL